MNVGVLFTPWSLHEPLEVSELPWDSTGLSGRVETSGVRSSESRIGRSTTGTRSEDPESNRYKSVYSSNPFYGPFQSGVRTYTTN